MSAEHVHNVSFGEDIVKVTVFEDRAEIKRQIAVKIEEGLNEVVIQNVSVSMNDDSVRVVGSGRAVIEEVQVTNRRKQENDEGSDVKLKELKEKRKQLEAHIKKIESDKKIGEKRTAALECMINKLGAGVANPHEGAVSANEDTFNTIAKFFDFYTTKTQEETALVAQLEEEAVRKQDELNALHHEISKLENGDYVKVVSILLNASAAEEMALEVTYQVWGARWNPLYDIRVETTDDKTNMTMTYLGAIYNSTGEQWTNAPVVLSTAKPSVGGEVPALGTMEVQFYQPPPPAPVYQAKMMKRGGVGMSFGAAAPMNMMMCDAMPEMACATAIVSQQSLSAEFSIVRACTIPSDGAQHKVTIGVLNLAPHLVHETVPCKAPTAFLTASATNTSAMPLLPGESSVYLDGAFISKTHVKSVSPGEHFRISLGADPAVRITYKPAHRVKEQLGMINKVSNLVHQQTIDIKNTRSDEIMIIVKEQIPRSTDEKIKVKVLSPEKMEAGEENDEEKPAVGVKHLPNNNVQWTVNVAKGQTKQLYVKYTIEHPITEKLDFVERM